MSAHQQSYHFALVKFGGILTAFALLLASCGIPAPAAAPAPFIFDSPGEQTSTFTRFFKEGCHFGGAIDLEHDLIAAGAPCWAQPPGYSPGSAYVLRRNPSGEITMEATLHSSDREDGFQYDQHFGGSVAIQGGVVAVGAPGYDDPQAGDNTGAVYFFENDGQTWQETARITSANPVPGAKLGRSLAWDGDWMAAGGAETAPSIVIFQRLGDEWRQAAELPVPRLPDGEPAHTLLDLYGDTLAVSAIAWQPPESEPELSELFSAGTVTLYEHTGDSWKQVYQTLPQEASLYRMYDESPFGLPVALGGENGKANLLAVGKPGFPKSGRDQGSVAIFARGNRGWAPQAELSLAQGELAPGALPFFGTDPGAAFFGAYVELDGNRLAVVSTFANTAYIFEQEGSSWLYRSRLVVHGKDTDGDDFQRRTTAMSGNHLLMGSPGELGGGEVYLFDLSP